MKDTVRLGRILGVRVGLNWSLIAMVALVAGELADNRFSYDAPGHSGAAYGLAGALTALGLLVGVLLHELGHAMVARRVGLRVDGITLSWMGGVTRMEGEAPSAGSEFVVAGVGPFVSAAFGGVLWGLRVLAESAGSGNLVVSALGWLAVINVVLAIFNLLPAAPLDGGRVLHAVVWGATRDRWKATRASGTAGVGLGVAMVALGFFVMTRSVEPLNGLFISLVGWWLVGSARVERTLGAVHHALDGVRLSQLMRPVGSAPGWITVRAFVDTYATGRPGWVWMLEGWGGRYEGVVLGDAVGAVPLPQWDLTRPIDVGTPLAAVTGAGPEDEILDAMARTGGKQVILVVDQDRTVGAVLPADVEALVRMGGRGPIPSNGWTLTRG